ncbi:MAG: hypothetical protein AAFY67_19810 [Cyanobacteria bacterium J06642_9]
MEQTLITQDFAILAPVPEQHLVTGLEAIAQQLDADPPKVPPVLAYGSNAFEVFGKADELRGEQCVEMFFYASHAENPTFHPEATWKATYCKQVHSRRGRYPGKAFHRPPSTKNDAPTWAIFWLVQDLIELREPILVSDFQGLGKKTAYASRFIPESPLLVEHPGLIAV